MSMEAEAKVIEAEVSGTGSNSSLPPHPASWRAMELKLKQETAARKLAEALHERKHEALEVARKRIARLEALVVGVHLSRGEELDDACILLDKEGQRIHGCIEKECDGGNL